MIKGLTPRLAEGGKIKIGGLGETRQSKSGSSYRVPEKHNYFTVTRTDRDSHGDLSVDEPIMQALVDAGYSDADGKIRSIPIVLHSDDIDEIMPTSYALYAGKKIACRGDGETAERFVFADKVRTEKTEKVACTCKLYEERKCKPHGTLHCSIALPGMAVAGSVHRWRTTSIISIQQMLGSLIQIRQAIGMLRNVPLVLRVREIEVAPDGKATRVPVCHVELRAKDVLELQERMLAQQQKRSTLLAAFDAENQRTYRAMLQAPAADDETIDEQAAVEAEFYPTEQPAELKAGVVKLGKKKDAPKAEPAPEAKPDNAKEGEAGEATDGQKDLGW